MLTATGAVLSSYNPMLFSWSIARGRPKMQMVLFSQENRALDDLKYEMMS